MIQELKCSKCGVNGVDTKLIAIPMAFVCNNCYSKANGKLELKIRQLETALTNQRLSDSAEWVRKNEWIEELKTALQHIAEDGCPKCGNVAEHALKQK